MNSPLSATPAACRAGPSLAGPALLLLAVLALGPLLLDQPPITWITPHSSTALRWAGKAAIVLAMFGAIGLRAWLDHRREPRSFRLALLLIVVAGLMIYCHWLMVDRLPVRAEWQKDRYLMILNHTSDAPHGYRPLPYGFTRGLERLTGDWWFACTAYRWFFTYWFLWAAYRFARLFHEPAQALLALLAVPFYYPWSVAFYYGQLTDPLSHALFVLALVYIVEDRWLVLAGALALGVMAKETAILLVPAYVACWWRRGLPALVKTAALGMAGTAAFLAVRLPLGWKPGNADLNGLNALMIGTNLGIGEPIALTGVPLYQNYLHPALLIGSFLPFIAWRWRQLDGRLQALFLTLTPLLLLSSLCFAWLYESRNYMPLVPLLATMAVPAAKPRSSGSRIAANPARR